MLHKGFGAMAVLAFPASIAALVAALQGSQSPSGSDNLWIATVAFLALGIIGAAGWLLTRDNGQAKVRPPSVKAKARNESTAIAAGRDIRVAGDLYAAPPVRPAKKRTTPSFDLQHQPASDGWVHLLLSNFAETGMFHVDVTRIEQATSEQTTPYPVKWRGYAGEDRQVVKDALIDFAQVDFPWHDDPNSGVIIITSRGRRVGNWRGGDFRLYSFSKQDGWLVEAQPREAPAGMSAELALFLDEIKIHVRAIRIDSGEQVERVVTIGFQLPDWNQDGQLWEAPRPAVRVQVEAKQ